MSRTIRWTKLALRRLDAVGAHIAHDDPKVAMRVITRVVSAVDRLADRPAIGRIGRIDGTRELVFADLPYIVAYRVTPTFIDILTIMHSAQRWPDQL
jgi:toxin ParE1/3/4